MGDTQWFAGGRSGVGFYMYDVVAMDGRKVVEFVSRNVCFRLENGGKARGFKKSSLWALGVCLGRTS